MAFLSLVALGIGNKGILTEHLLHMTRVDKLHRLRQRVCTLLFEQPFHLSRCQDSVRLSVCYRDVHLTAHRSLAIRLVKHCDSSDEVHRNGYVEYADDCFLPIKRHSTSVVIVW